MSTNHSANMQNEITREEHDGTNNAKRVNIVAGSLSGGQATITPVGLVTLAPSPNFIGIVTVTNPQNIGNVTLNPSPNFIGITTVANRDRTITGNLTLSDPKTYIGLTTTTLGASPAFVGIVTVTNRDMTITGNLTLTDSKGFIGLATVNIGSSNATLFAVVNTSAAGQASVVIDTGVNFIGIVTVANPSSFTGNITLDAGSKTQIAGNVTITDSKGFIGLTTSTLGASPAFIGIVTVTNKDRTITGNLTLSDAKTFIGLTTTTLGASPAFVGIVTVTNRDMTITGNVTITDSKGFIGLVTANSINVGTNKTLIHKNVAFAQASIVTIAVPSNTFKITHLAINSSATVRLNIKSGASYLTGNVSLGMNINPGGGWVENGSPDSPVYIGLAAASAIVIEKLDLTATSAQIGGKLIYFDE